MPYPRKVSEKWESEEIGLGIKKWNWRRLANKYTEDCSIIKYFTHNSVANFSVHVLILRDFPIQ